MASEQGIGRATLAASDRASLLDAARDAARVAAAFVRERSRELDRLVWQTKSAADFVTEVDTGAEERIRDVLARRVPDGVLVGEELSPTAIASASRGIAFVADPLDGTTNFLHGYPWYAVSIGVLVDGVLEAGVIINVPRGDEFSATRGGGAIVSDGGDANATRSIRVSSNADPSRALVGTGFPFKSLGDLNAYKQQFDIVTRHTAGIRRAGAAALDLCDVACGRFDAFWELTLAPWDVAAGLLIVREAGGIATDLVGRNASVQHGPIVAGSPVMHAWLLERLTRSSP